MRNIYKTLAKAMRLSLKLLFFFIFFLMQFRATANPAKISESEKHWEMAHYFYSIGSYAEAETETRKILAHVKHRKAIDRNYINGLLLEAKCVQKQFRF